MHPLSWWVTVAVVLLVAKQSAAQAVPPKCPTSDTTICAESPYSNGDYVFTVKDVFIRIKYVESISLTIKCEKTSGMTKPLDEGNVPVFESTVYAQNAKIIACPAPLHSYPVLFATLNVKFPDGLSLIVENLHGEMNLTGTHFAGLSSLSYLRLINIGPFPLDFLGNISLKGLLVADSPILQSEFDAISNSFNENSTLVTLSLRNTTVSRVSANLLALPTLEKLKVLESGPVVVERAAAQALRILQVEAADEELMSTWAPPAATEVYLAGWAAERPRPLPACERLSKLTVKSPRALRLPERWVAACPRLVRLEVKLARFLTELPATLLANATSLTTFLFTNGHLTSLHADLFNESRRLTSVDLTDNHLMTLPSGLFYYQRLVLSELRLGGNRLTRAVLSAGLGALPALARLVLAHNPDLSDECGRDPLRDGIFVEHKGESGLNSLGNLTYLDLKNTSVGVICSDWREKLKKLKTLDLSYTKINRLTSDDMHFSWEKVGSSSEVILEHTPLVDIAYGPEEYAADAEAAARGEIRVPVKLGGPESRLPCDCRMYWPAAALRAGIGPLRVAGRSSLWCDPAALHKLDLGRIDSLLCAQPQACARVPAACQCGTRSLPANRTLLRVACEGAALTAVPRFPRPPPDVVVDLLLANNSITELHLDDLPPGINTFDLRNNSLERVEEKAALALIGAAKVGASVLLADNRLACDCRAAHALRALLRLEQKEGLTLTCAAGEPVDTALAALRCEDTPRLGVTLAPALGAAALFAAVGGALLALPATRRRLKELLGSMRGEPPLRFDLFLTFDAGGERQALEVAARLEPRYAVCLQERDWVPPARVAACLAASVAASRRTVALASARWAAALDAGTAEGAALAAALRSHRLVAVLLEPPPTGALSRYLQRHPHAALRLDDADFWQKLAAALPPPSVEPATPPSKRAEVVPNI